eukprot:TRINITY_DN10231_c0_g1_i1.p1 TRINITY_DN10231_c0_g1~~TRINITY_DN10231_c0_g1_i1.p1  ORF type:complete len:571 (+),score=112.37 TRINITY_DN10231_c0_g1_i1:1867-3579(+)
MPDVTARPLQPVAVFERPVYFHASLLDALKQVAHLDLVFSPSKRSCLVVDRSFYLRFPHLDVCLPAFLVSFTPAGSLCMLTSDVWLQHPSLQHVLKEANKDSESCYNQVEHLSDILAELQVRDVVSQLEQMARETDVLITSLATESLYPSTDFLLRENQQRVARALRMMNVASVPSPAAKLQAEFEVSVHGTSEPAGIDAEADDVSIPRQTIYQTVDADTQDQQPISRSAFVPEVSVDMSSQPSSPHTPAQPKTDVKLYDSVETALLQAEVALLSSRVDRLLQLKKQRTTSTPKSVSSGRIYIPITPVRYAQQQWNEDDPLPRYSDAQREASHQTHQTMNTFSTSRGRGDDVQAVLPVFDQARLDDSRRSVTHRVITPVSAISHRLHFSDSSPDPGTSTTPTGNTGVLIRQDIAERLIALRARLTNSLPDQAGSLFSAPADPPYLPPVAILQAVSSSPHGYGPHDTVQDDAPSCSCALQIVSITSDSVVLSWSDTAQSASSTRYCVRRKAGLLDTDTEDRSEERVVFEGRSRMLIDRGLLAGWQYAYTVYVCVNGVWSSPSEALLVSVNG